MVVVALLVGAGGFFAGMKYQESKRGGGAGQFANGRGGRFGAGAGATGTNGANRNGFRPVAGDIIAKDATSVTVKLADGSSKIVLVSDKTTINKASTATRDELKVGEKVAVFGTDNSDGSVTAQSIQLNPTMGPGGGTPNKSQKSPDAKEIVVEGSNFTFSPNTLKVKKGEKTRIVFKNTEGMHDFRVDELNIKTASIREGQEDFVEFTADKKGSFEFYCSVANHRMMGMKGTVVVE